MSEVGEEQGKHACHCQHHYWRDVGILSQERSRASENVEVVASVKSFIQLAQTSDALHSETKITSSLLDCRLDGEVLWLLGSAFSQTHADALNFFSE